MSNPVIEIKSLKQGVPADGGRMEILVRVVAPRRAESRALPERPPLDLALVIDRSGSMEGAPLDEAKRCAMHVVERLLETDQASVVVYDNRVATPVPMTPARPLAPFEVALRAVAAGGSTDLHAGWAQGRDSFQTPPRQGSLKRILLLSDGCANSGVTDIEEISAQCRMALERGIGTTTIGLGRHFNEDLMTRMASAGGGRSYYGERAEDLLDAFSEEFALLSNLHSRQLALRFNWEPGVRLVSVAGRPADGQGVVALPDVAWDSVSWVQLTLECDAMDAIERCLFTATVSGESETGRWESEPTALVLPVLDRQHWTQLPDDSDVAARVVDTRVGALLEAARASLNQGDVETARNLLGVARGLAIQSPWLLQSIDALERLLESDRRVFAKEALFARSKMSSRLVARDDVVLDDAGETARFLNPKVMQGRRREP